VISKPTLDTDIHIEFVKGFKGRVTLENVHLSNVKNRPCIDIVQDCEVTLELVGDNELRTGGIRVDESASLTLSGKGNLSITLDSPQYYGIGNGSGKHCGLLKFEQSGCVTINAHGQTGVGIGSWDGGKVIITAGQYHLNLNGDTGLGIGALFTDCELDIASCDINTDIALAKGVGNGSVTGNCRLHFRLASTNIYMAGSTLVGIGTIRGKQADVHIHDASTAFNIRGERCCAIAALDGRTDFLIERAGLRITSGGRGALALGGLTNENNIELNSADTNIMLETTLDTDRYINKENLKIVSGRCLIEVNGEEKYTNI
jgi:hypothetical protein